MCGTRFFCSCDLDLDLDPMTFIIILELATAILNIYLHTKNITTPHSRAVKIRQVYKGAGICVFEKAIPGGPGHGPGYGVQCRVNPYVPFGI